MKKIALFILPILLLSGCATMNPFYNQYQQLNQAYQAGQLTYPQYIQAYQNLQAQEMQWRQNLQQASYQMQQQQQQYYQQQWQRQMDVLRLNQQQQRNSQTYSTESRCHLDPSGNIVCDTTVTH